jgi:hypothetical protein
MNGFNNLPNKTDQNTYLFYANASSSLSGSFQAWNVPEYATFLHFTIVGGGAGGGGGCGGTSLAAGRGGGGGGAPGGLAAVSIPTILLPKTLYLQVGYGGAPGTGSNNQAVAGQNGQNGTISYVCLYPEINPGSVLIQSSNTEPGGGGGGSAAGTAGTAITIADTTNLKWLGIVGNTVAQLGASAGGLAGNGGSVTYTGLLTGGAGGGGKVGGAANGSSGGSVTMASINSYVATAINGGAGGVSASGSNGSSGYFSWKPFIATGGAGGGAGAAVSFNGGDGGKGAYGCGGGGGGAAGNIGGSGGPGGDGLIIIAVS